MSRWKKCVWRHRREPRKKRIFWKTGPVISAWRSYFEEKLADLVKDSVNIHTRADVPIGSYISGGIDSSLIGSLASKTSGGQNMVGFTGKFEFGDLYDESQYARDLCDKAGFELYERIDTTVCLTKV